MKKKYVIKIKQPNETSMTMKKNGEREKKDHHHISIANERVVHVLHSKMYVFMSEGVIDDSCLMNDFLSISFFINN